MTLVAERPLTPGDGVVSAALSRTEGPPPGSSKLKEAMARV